MEIERDIEYLYEQAIETIKDTHKASIPVLQRRLQIHYITAYKIMQMLEDRGAIGPDKGTKPRDIYINL